MKRRVNAYAEERDETEAIIIREALAEYFAKRTEEPEPAKVKTKKRAA